MLAYLFGFFVYPGALVVVALGLAVESGASLAMPQGTQAWRRAALGVRRLTGEREIPPAISGTALLALLAVIQISVPFNPIPSSDRNLLIAGTALAGASLLAWPWAVGPRGDNVRLLLVTQGGWLASLLALIIAVGSLRPQAIGEADLGAILPLKVAAGLAFLLSLPGMLGLLQGPVGREGAARGSRLLLWLPLCGLFASLFIPPQSGDVAGLGIFLIATLASAGAVLLVGAVVSRGTPAVKGGYMVLTAALAVLALILAGLGSFVPGV